MTTRKIDLILPEALVRRLHFVSIAALLAL
jgi:hypothetical protein